jgi:hypothetical protein
MKISDAEWQWDRRKLTIYFTAEKRVDFRNLVRELAAHFRTRIELRQIGVRDEAKRLSGVGRCGREYCSASWLPDLRPVNLGVAKDQRLSLNPTQISGACGRLMCCLRYEHDFYVQSRRRFPKEGRILRTARGEEKVVAIDIFRDTVTLRSPEGDVRVAPLAELRAETDRSGGVGLVGGEALTSAAVAVADAPAELVETSVAEPDVTEPEAVGSLRDQDADDDANDDANDDPNDDPNDDADSAQAGGEDAPRRKRRRGRRGGRRARGDRPPRGDADAPPVNPPAPDA